MRRCTIAECVVHGREFRLHVFLTQSHKPERLHHDLRVVITDRTGRQLHAVAHQIVLISQNGKRFHRLQRLHTALRHGKRIMAEFHLSGLLPDLVHGEIHDPAELVAGLSEMALRLHAQHSAQHAGSLHRRVPVSGRHAHEIARL